MEEYGQIIIKRRKWIAFLFSFFSLMLIILFLMVWFIPPDEDTQVTEIWFIRILSILMIALFVFCLCFFVHQIFRNSTIAVINNKGIYDYSKRKSVGLISWHDIDSVYVTSHINSNMLCITLKNRSKYLPEKKVLFKFIHNYNKKYGGDIFISLEMCKVNLFELKDTIEYFHKKSKELIV